MTIPRKARYVILLFVIVFFSLFLIKKNSISFQNIFDSFYILHHIDPALSTRYDWPVELQFEAPLALPHINNFPAFARIGAWGTVKWNDNNLTVQLYEVSHAAERTEWFDCKTLQEVRVGLTSIGFFGDGHSVDNPQGNWSAWQPVVAKRTGQGAYSAKGDWSFSIPVPLASKPWKSRLAIEAKCTVKDG